MKKLKEINKNKNFTKLTQKKWNVVDFTNYYNYNCNNNCSRGSNTELQKLEKVVIVHQI